jgi:TolB-like protein/DNA-binding winged helix-turn-helix (wHTH) protein/Flp pilus assembly protein TadD
MPEFTSSVRAIRFGVFEVDLRAGELRKKGIRIKLQEQPFLLLVTLLEQRGEIITREELSRTLWPDGTFIDFDHGLGSAINRLREALGDSAANPRFVETVPRRGFRFIAPIETVSGGTPVVSEIAQSAESPSGIENQAGSSRKTIAPNHPSWLHDWRGPSLLLFVILALLAIWILHRASRPSPVIRSLAVLPLVNLSGDASQEYFSDGMTDELIAELGQISELRVTSRTSVMTYKGVRKPLPQIARELNVDAVVEGTALRSGSRIRITAQLIQASADKHLWAQSYEGDLRDTLALQSKVAREIAGQIRIKLNPQEQAGLKNVKVVNPEAHEDYLKGRYFWNKRTGNDLEKAVDYFNRSINKDPNYAQAYSGLADSYALMGDWEYGVMAPQEAFAKAKAAAIKALALDGTLGEAHTSLAFSLDLFDWDWESAGKEYRRAIELNPSYATAHQWYAWHLIVLGQNSEAIAEIRKAESLDPLSLIISADMADVLLVARRYDESIQQSRKTIEMDPRFGVAYYQLGQAFAQKHMHQEAITEFQKAIGFSGGNKTFTASLAYAYAVSGRTNDALNILKDLNEPSKNGFSNASEIALVYIGLNNKDQAFASLEKAYKERFNPSIIRRPYFDPLRADPRFHDLLGRIGLSQ